MAGLRLIANATVEPVTLAEAYLDLRLDPIDDIDSDGNGTRPDDDLIEALIAAARERCENWTGRSFAIKTYELARDDFPDDDEDDGNIVLPNGPVIDVVSVSYGDESTDVLLEGEDWVLDQISTPARLVPASSGWPSITAATNRVRVQYRVGYGTATDSEPTPDAIPAIAKRAIRVLVAQGYHQDEPDEQVWPRVQSMLRPLRVQLGMA